MPYIFTPEYLVEPPPLVANDDAATTPSNTPVNIPVLANDTLDENPVQLADLVGPPTVFEPPANGTVEVQPDGSIIYTPNPGFAGVDTFEYEIETPLDCVQLEVHFYNNDGILEPYLVKLADGQAEPDWWSMNELTLDLPSGQYDLSSFGVPDPEYQFRIVASQNPLPDPEDPCPTTETGEALMSETPPQVVCVTWLCAPALLNLGCSWEPRGNEPSTDDSGGIAFKPYWFVDNDPFTVSDPINGWTETWQWNGSPDFSYTLLSSTGTSTRPNCCGNGIGLTLTQGSNSVDLGWRYNCA